MSGHNRLSEIYSGEIGEQAEQQRCRDRINWLCKQARGHHVLDVGCNQGMASLLLGRTGMKVTGIDLDQENIGFALDLLQREEKEVRERVEFQTSDAAQIPYPDNHFDSALLGDVLEWVADPELILSEMARALKADSPVAISLTLGFEMGSDPRKTYLLTGFLELIEKHFTVMDVKFSQNSILARTENRRPDESALSDPVRFQQWVRDFEQSYLKNWSKANTRIVELDSQHSELTTALQALDDEKTSAQTMAQSESEQLHERMAILQSNSDSAHERAASLEQEVTTLKAQKGRMAEELDQSQASLDEEIQTKQTQEDSLARLKTELEDEKQRHRQTHEDFSRRQSEAEELKQSVVRLETELLATHQRALALEKEVAERKASSEAQTNSTHELQVRLHKTESALNLSKRDLETAQKASEDLARVHSSLQGRYEEAQSRQEESAAAIRLHQDSLRSVERGLAQAESQRDRLDEQLRMLSTELRNERALSRETLDEKQSIQIEAASLRSEVAFLREINAENQSQLEKAEKESLRLAEEMNSARDQLKETEFSHAENERAHQQERESLEHRVEQLTNTLSTSESALSSLQSEYDRASKQGQNQLLALSRKLEDADSAWKRQRTALQDSLAKARILKSDLSSAEQELARTRQQVGAIEARHVDLEAEKTDLAGRLTASESETVQAHARHAAIVSDLEQRSAEVESKRSQIEAELNEKRDYLDRLQELFKKEQANHKKVYASLQRHTEAWEKRGRELALAKSSAESTSRRLLQVEAEMSQLKSALSFRVVTKLNSILQKLKLKGTKKAITADPRPIILEEEKEATTSAISAAPNLPRQRPDRVVAPGETSLPRTAAILDEFSMACFAPDCEMITFRTDNWRERLEANKPELLLVESAWHGNDDSWQYRVASYEKNMGDELLDLIDWCKSESIPTVFWNKEDPVHYDRFIDSARHFDVILTSDARCTEQYEKEVGHSRIHALPFAAQPEIHNPVRAEARTGQVCFAGSYYANRFEQRREDMDNILKPALDYGLDIFDRNHGLVIPGTDHFRFPDIYQSAIRGRLEYDEMVEAYKRYRVFLNVNSVKNSRTMFSRRVFELMACGTPVISTPSVGISELLGDDLVVRAESERETRDALERLLKDEDEWARMSALGIRKVLAEHTYKVRFDSVLEFAGIGRRESDAEKVVCIANPQSQKDLESLTDTILSQASKPDDLFLLETRSIKKKWLRSVTEKIQASGIRIQVMNRGQFRSAVQACDSNTMLAFLSCHDSYGPHYLDDHLQSLIYSPTGVLGKAGHFQRGGSAASAELIRKEDEHHIVSSVPAATVCARRNSLKPEQIEELAYGGHFEFKHENIYAGHRFNYCRNLDGKKSGRLSSALEEKIHI